MEALQPSRALLIGSGKIFFVQQLAVALTLVQTLLIAIKVIAARNTIIARKVRRILRILARALGRTRTFTVQELLHALPMIVPMPSATLEQASCPRASRKIAAYITSIVTQVGLK